MLINVPQYIDIEDKIAGPLTAKQLGWVMLLGILLLILWNVLPKFLFFIVAIPIGMFLLGMAFYRPYGQPLPEFLVSSMRYLFKPKVYIWKRTVEKANTAKQVKIEIIKKEEKSITAENLRELSQLLDSEGTIYNQNVKSILKEKEKPKKLF